MTITLLLAKINYLFSKINKLHLGESMAKEQI
jgi:hypothetical protein